MKTITITITPAEAEALEAAAEYCEILLDADEYDDDAEPDKWPPSKTAEAVGRIAERAKRKIESRANAEALLAAHPEW